RRTQDDQGADRQGKGQSWKAQHGRGHDHVAAGRAAVRQALRCSARSVQGQRRDRSSRSGGNPRFRPRQHRHGLAADPSPPLSRAAKKQQPTAALLPDAPSLPLAADLPGLDESSPGAAVVAPAGTAAAIIDKIHREVASIYADAAMSANLEKMGILPIASSAPAEFDVFIRSETERWSKVFKDSGNIKLD